MRKVFKKALAYFLVCTFTFMLLLDTGGIKVYADFGGEEIFSSSGGGGSGAGGNWGISDGNRICAVKIYPIWFNENEYVSGVKSVSNMSSDLANARDYAYNSGTMDHIAPEALSLYYQTYGAPQSQVGRVRSAQQGLSVFTTTAIINGYSNSFTQLLAETVSAQGGDLLKGQGFGATLSDIAKGYDTEKLKEDYISILESESMLSPPHRSAIDSLKHADNWSIAVECTSSMSMPSASGNRIEALWSVRDYAQAVQNLLVAEGSWYTNNWVQNEKEFFNDAWEKGNPVATNGTGAVASTLDELMYNNAGWYKKFYEPTGFEVQGYLNPQFGGTILLHLLATAFPDTSLSEQQSSDMYYKFGGWGYISLVEKEEEEKRPGDIEGAILRKQTEYIYDKETVYVKDEVLAEWGFSHGNPPDPMQYTFSAVSKTLNLESPTAGSQYDYLETEVNIYWSGAGVETYTVAGNPDLDWKGMRDLLYCDIEKGETLAGVPRGCEIVVTYRYTKDFDTSLYQSRVIQEQKLTQFYSSLSSFTTVGTIVSIVDDRYEMPVGSRVVTPMIPEEQATTFANSKDKTWIPGRSVTAEQPDGTTETFYVSAHWSADKITEVAYSSWYAGVHSLSNRIEWANYRAPAYPLVSQFIDLTGVGVDGVRQLGNYRYTALSGIGTGPWDNKIVDRIDASILVNRYRYDTIGLAIWKNPTPATLVGIANSYSKSGSAPKTTKIRAEMVFSTNIRLSTSANNGSVFKYTASHHEYEPYRTFKAEIVGVGLDGGADGYVEINHSSTKYLINASYNRYISPVRPVRDDYTSSELTQIKEINLSTSDRGRNVESAFTFSTQANKPLKVVPEVTMWYDSASGSTLPVVTTGDKIRQFNPISYHTFDIDLIGMKIATNSSAVATDSRAMTLSQKFGNAPVYLAGSNISTAMDGVKVTATSYVLDIIDNTAKTTWNGSTWNPEADHNTFINLLKSSTSNVGYTISKGNLDDGETFWVPCNTVANHVSATLLTNTYNLVIRGGLITEVTLNGANVTSSPEWKTIADGMKLDTLLAQTFAKGEGSGGWYNEDSTILAVREYSTVVTMTGSVASDKISLTAGPKAQDDRNQQFSNGYAGHISWQLIFNTNRAENAGDLEGLPSPYNTNAKTGAKLVFVYNKNMVTNATADFVIPDVTIMNSFQ